ncbi:MAG TPA: RDD family protein [Pseudoxanthomonas sp.]|nr:RDD family protein [Pseudoxanthomonas sp.]
MEDTAPPDPAPGTPEVASAPPRPRALVGWRLLSLFYDLWPVLALWMLVALPFVVLDAVLAGDVRHNIAPGSVLSHLQFLASLGVAGLYATLSWRRGGQTLGMRPWRLKLIATHGGAPGWKALWLRFAVGLLSLLAGGLGFWWAWFDRDRLAWHDRASGTRLVRVPKR